MNSIQEAIVKVTGVDRLIAEKDSALQALNEDQLEVAGTLEQLIADNHLLQRQIEDLDYLNLYELNSIQEIMPYASRKQTLNRLRRLRHDNPLAKQAVKLIIRFTLGRGVQWMLSEEKDTEFAGLGMLDFPITFRLTDNPSKAPAPSDSGPSNGSFPPKPATSTPTNGAVKKVSEANDSLITSQSTPADDPILAILKAFWNDSDNKLAFTTHHGLQQWLDEIVTDGEKFHACFEANTEPYVRITEIPVEEIIQIIYDPDNRLKPVYYKRQWMPQQYDGQTDTYKPADKMQTRYYRDYRIKDDELAELQKRIKIPKAKIDPAVRIRHTMINEIWTKNGKRGLSELFASREWFKVFREFMEGRASINAAAQAISYIRKIKGGPTAVAGFQNKFGGLTVGDSNTSNELQKLTKPTQAAIFNENQAVDLEWMKTDTGAANAKEDARLLLMAAGAGVSTFEHYFGDGGDANLATAQSMELPMVKTYEDWQQFTDNFIRETFRYVLSVALNGDEEAADEAIDRVVITFPAIISQDVVKYSTAWAQVVRDIAPNNPTIKIQAVRALLVTMGVQNVNALMPAILDDMRKAELQRQATMANLLTPPGQQDPNNPNPDPNDLNADGKPPVAGQTPNLGMPPQLKSIANGKVPALNGPKPG